MLSTRERGGARVAICELLVVAATDPQWQGLQACGTPAKRTHFVKYRIVTTVLNLRSENLKCHNTASSGLDRKCEVSHWAFKLQVSSLTGSAKQCAPRGRRSLRYLLATKQLCRGARMLATAAAAVVHSGAARQTTP